MGGKPRQTRKRRNEPPELTPRSLRAALGQLLHTAAAWETGAFDEGDPETQAAHVGLLKLIVAQAFDHWQRIPPDRDGKNVIRSGDGRVLRLWQAVNYCLEHYRHDRDYAIQNITFYAGLIDFPVTHLRLNEFWDQQRKQTGSDDWVRVRRGSSEATMLLISRVFGISDGRLRAIKRVFSRRDPKDVQVNPLGFVLSDDGLTPSIDRDEFHRYLVTLLTDDAQKRERILEVLLEKPRRANSFTTSVLGSRMLSAKRRGISTTDTPEDETAGNGGCP